jgi:hypothetical protein
VADSRKAPRYALRCRAEINEWAAVDDCVLRNVSLRGCYVETNTVADQQHSARARLDLEAGSIFVGDGDYFKARFSKDSFSR